MKESIYNRIPVILEGSPDIYQTAKTEFPESAFAQHDKLSV
jgi:hypothetical protein